MKFEVDAPTMEGATEAADTLTTGLPPITVDGQSYESTAGNVAIKEQVVNEIELETTPITDIYTTTSSDGRCKSFSLSLTYYMLSQVTCYVMSYALHHLLLYYFYLVYFIYG